MKFNKIILPNAVTSLNILSGAISILISLKFHDKLYLASLFILLASVFDFSDGFVARLFKAQSEFGKQYDSLSDVVSFGLAPAFIMFVLIDNNSSNFYLPFISFLILLCSAIRLAIFNITVQKDTFTGMPTPALAIFVASIPLTLKFSPSYIHLINIYTQNILSANVFLTIVTIILSLLLVSKIRMFSLKFANFKLKENKIRFFLIFSAIVFGIFLWWLAIQIVILIYILASFVLYLKKNKNCLKSL